MNHWQHGLKDTARDNFFMGAGVLREVACEESLPVTEDKTPSLAGSVYLTDLWRV